MMMQLMSKYRLITWLTSLLIISASSTPAFSGGMGWQEMAGQSSTFTGQTVDNTISTSTANSNQTSNQISHLNTVNGQVEACYEDGYHLQQTELLTQNRSFDPKSVDPVFKRSLSEEEKIACSVKLCASTSQPPSECAPYMEYIIGASATQRSELEEKCPLINSRLASSSSYPMRINSLSIDTSTEPRFPDGEIKQWDKSIGDHFTLLGQKISDRSIPNDSYAIDVLRNFYSAGESLNQVSEALTKDPGIALGNYYTTQLYRNIEKVENEGAYTTFFGEFPEILMSVIPFAYNLQESAQDYKEVLDFDTKTIYYEEFDSGSDRAFHLAEGLLELPITTIAAVDAVSDAGVSLKRTSNALDNTPTTTITRNGNRIHNNGLRSEFYDETGKATHWRNPETNQVELIPDNAKIHNDHIYSKNDIKELDDFDLLTPEQQKQILDTPENFQPLTQSMNCSKGCTMEGTDLSWNPSQNVAPEGLDAGYRIWLEQEQILMRDQLQQDIYNMLYIDEL